MARPQWSRILNSAVEGIVDQSYGHKVHHLAAGRAHLYTRISGDVAVSHPTYNELVGIIEDEFKSKGYTIDKENRKLKVDSPCSLMRHAVGSPSRWIADLHIYLYPPA